MVYVSDKITREYSFLNFNKHFVFRKGHSNPEVGQPSPQNTYMLIRTWIIFWFVNSERPENLSSQYLNYRPKITGEDSFSHCWNNWHDSSAYSNTSPSTDGGSIDDNIVKNTFVQVVLMRVFSAVVYAKILRYVYSTIEECQMLNIFIKDRRDYWNFVKQPIMRGNCRDIS